MCVLNTHCYVIVDNPSQVYELLVKVSDLIHKHR